MKKVDSLLIELIRDRREIIEDSTSNDISHMVLWYFIMVLSLIALLMYDRWSYSWSSIMNGCWLFCVGVIMCQMLCNCSEGQWLNTHSCIFDELYL